MAAAPPTDFRHLATGQPFNLLLAIENDINALVAIQVADELTRRGAIPKVVNVTRSLRAPYGSSSAQSHADTIFGDDFRSNRCRLLQDLISDAVGEGKDWAVESVIGDPATRILEAAASEDAELIVIGINHHGLMAQAMGEHGDTHNGQGKCTRSRRAARDAYQAEADHGGHRSGPVQSAGGDVRRLPTNHCRQSREQNDRRGQLASDR